MAKSRDKGNRETKKPKADKKSPVLSGPSDRPRQAPPPPATKQKRDETRG